MTTDLILIMYIYFMLFFAFELSETFAFKCVDMHLLTSLGEGLGARLLVSHNT